ncbi:AfsR/SARP family transcriptional regulator [Kitasatospora kifunensis]|uniref:DNA-binding SARP family transcriptional activator/tetratricopeptide (TPR) repeat protein n=1 Tax=Kitasatospora kifunensis TaxID=58351 RepID=A0A7W7QZ72_KITKI|nr:AfsR/SARP family transcriptional regulator [Kitasatospora kifunensis]MBB4922532.1 DNA-binding SARP family transcriptional activator/tetratricopeptide (TPR) repeat protein [Kitasatospora kifunensis]
MFAVSPEKVRCLLAALAWDAGRPLALDTLADRLWDARLPADPAGGVHSNVSKLRRALNNAAKAESDGPVPLILSRGHAYTLDVDPGIVDYHRFRRLTGRAREATEHGDDITALSLLDQANALWTGDPLAGLRGEWANDARATLTDERLAAAVTHAEVGMRMGHFAELVTDLAPLVSAHPTHQTLVARLMLALHGAGRQDEALARYQATFRNLGKHLGIAPGRELADLHAQILAGEPAAKLVPRARLLSAKTSPAALAAPAAPAPLSPATASSLRPLRPLVGRERELAELTAGPGVVSISGMGGIGKTALALHAAQLLHERYPDGSHLLNLHANSASQAPLTPQQAVPALFRMLGFPSGAVPTEHEQRIALWHRLLEERRYVIVLDDVADGAQVRALVPVPGQTRSFVILTSRRRLSELTGVRQHFIDGLSPEHGVELFQRLVNSERAGNAGRIREILGRFAYHPLATEILASRFRGRRSWSLEYLAQRLATSTRLVDEIRDTERDLRPVLDFSYLALAADHQRAFRLLGLYPGPRFALPSAAALLGLAPAEAERSLEELLDASLLQEVAPELYAFHDLLGGYAASLADAEGSPEEREAAFARLLSFELAAVDQADRLLYPHRLRLDRPEHAGDRPPEPPAWGTPAEARRWLVAELPGLLALQRHAAAHAQSAEAAWLAHSFAGFLDVEGFWHEAIELHRATIEHWRSTGDRRGEVRALIDLGNAHRRTAQPLRAVAAINEALALARLTDDFSGAAEALSQRGVLHGDAGEFDDALTLQREALATSRTAGDSRQSDRILNNIGLLSMFLQDNSTALAHLEAAHAGFQRLGNVGLAAATLNNIGQVLLLQGDSRSARAAFERCLTSGAEVLSTVDIASARSNLATALDRPEDLPTALALAASAVDTFRQFEALRPLLLALMTLGDVQLRAHQGTAAAETFQEAVVLATALDADRERAASERSLGIAELSLGHYDAGRQHLTTAITLASHVHDQKTADEAKKALSSITPHAASMVDESRAPLWPPKS